MAWAAGLSACCRGGGGDLGSSNGEPQIATQTGVTSPDQADAAVDFGNVPLGQTKTITLSLQNTGIASLTVISVDETVSDPEFTVDLAEGSVVQSGAPLAVPVHFTPFSVGQKNATFVLHTDSADVPAVTVTLTGQGVKLEVTVTPQGIDFGKVVVHTQETENVTIANASALTVSLTISAIQGAEAALFSEGALSSTTLAANQSVTLPITYAPTTVSQTPDTAFFTVGYCDGCNAVTVDLRGEAVDTGLSVTPNPLDFGFDPPGTPVTRSIKLQNVANRVIHMTATPLLNPGNPAAFALAANAPTFPLAIAAGTEVDVPVVFTPPALGQYTGSLLFTSDDPQAGEVTVQLSGVGGGGQIQCLPESLAYGTVAVGVPVTQKVLCTNVGQDVPGFPGGSLQITGLTVPDDPAFVAHFDTPFPLGGLTAGQSALIDVVYTAVNTAGDSGHLHIASNDTQNPTTLVPLSGTGSNLPPCDFTIAPQGGLQFGFVAQGATAQLQFAIVNNGANDCLVNGLNLSGTSDPSFSLPNGPIASQTLSYTGNPTGAASTLPVTVQFAPTQYGTFAGDVTFTISDPTNPQQDVHVTGTSQPGCLLVAPNNLDFGVVGVNPATQAWCSSVKRDFTAYNTCNYDVHITSITMNPGVGGNEFVLSGQPSSYPVDVPPGSTPVTFQVAFHPDSAGTKLGSLSIATQEMPSSPYLVTFHGEANANAVQTDTFVQSSQPKVDILWIIDNDDNGQVQQLVAQNIPSFMQYAQSQGIDYHIAVTSDDVCQGPTSDDGWFEPCAHCAETGTNAEIITPQTPDPVGALGTLIQLGQSGGCDDPLFEPAYEALQPALLAGHNAGFLRPDAYLAIIGVSDADDDSPQSVQFYYNFFESIKGFQNASQFSFSAVNETPADAPLGGCANGIAFDSTSVTRVPQMVQMTGGINVSICTNDWGTALEQLGNIAFGGRLSFPLTAQPANPASITVTDCFQGSCTTEPSTLPNGFVEWTYDPTTNSIVFDPNAAPQPGDTLTVTYDVACS
ncbi:MAG TPA: choice-of-anchor D domain-containing protein [Myxococcales bacterium]|nr:choice-of-anchor D domain-containing protein [Myxococcales bacterium]